MGLLDDAIREHMELKRLRGADPAVIAQQEHDALGPVLREEDVEGDVTEEDLTDAAAPAAPHAEGAVVPQANGAAAPNVGNAAQAPNDDAAEPQQPGHDSADHDPDFASVGQETAELDMRTVLEIEGEHGLEGEHGPVGSASHLEPPGLAAGPDEDGGLVEDVLEETPDFLRDTPEQERLWFEQQPPRDFDFDK